jgi:general secretion pathway protein G
MTATRNSIRSARSRKGFTLVEILIVVIILGILAAIVIPQFTNASTDARQSNMASQDQTIKSQISLYSLQHNDTYPTLANLWTDLTSISDVNGNIPPATGATPLGPYLQSTPVNPLTNTSAVADLGSASTSVGWVYNAATGEFHGVNATGVQSDTGQ